MHAVVLIALIFGVSGVQALDPAPEVSATVTNLCIDRSNATSTDCTIDGTIETIVRFAAVIENGGDTVIVTDAGAYVDNGQGQYETVQLVYSFNSTSNTTTRRICLIDSECRNPDDQHFDDCFTDGGNSQGLTSNCSVRIARDECNFASVDGLDLDEPLVLNIDFSVTGIEPTSIAVALEQSVNQLPSCTTPAVIAGTIIGLLCCCFWCLCCCCMLMTASTRKMAKSSAQRSPTIGSTRIDFA